MSDGDECGPGAIAECGVPTTHSAALEPGQRVNVIKLHPLGHEVTRYPGRVLDLACPPSWFALEATWVNKRVDANGLVFETGDTLIELFSTELWFDVFHVLAPDGTYRGWYANVTHPTRVECRGHEIDVVWHDLYLDVIMPFGQDPRLCDEDELEEAGLEQADPDLFARIQRTADGMIADAAAGEFPFVVPALRRPG